MKTAAKVKNGRVKNGHARKSVIKKASVKVDLSKTNAESRKKRLATVRAMAMNMIKSKKM